MFLAQFTNIYIYIYGHQNSCENHTFGNKIIHEENVEEKVGEKCEKDISMVSQNMRFQKNICIYSGLYCPKLAPENSYMILFFVCNYNSKFI